MAPIADEIAYKLDDVETTSLGPDDIDKTFRSSCIGKESPQLAQCNTDVVI